MAVGGRLYPIGDEFRDASGIPLGATEENLFGQVGYAVIQGAPEYRRFREALPDC
jgi:hypothetical protein